MRLGTREFARWTIAATVAIAILLVNSALAGLIDNGGFERQPTSEERTAGQLLPGWNLTLASGGDAFAGEVTRWPLSGSPSWSPTEGAYFARLKTDGAGSWTQIYQSFSASAGDILSFDYFWDAEGADKNQKYDQAEGKILSGTGLSGSVLTTLFSRSVQLDPIDTGWIEKSYSFTRAGDYTLWFRIENVGSAANDSNIGIDHVRLVPVPLPASILLGAFAVGLAGRKLRQFV